MLVQIFKEKSDKRNCDIYRGIKLIEYTMKIIERVVQRRIQELVSVDAIQSGFMPGRELTEELLRRKM